jgi:hypothetical protein
MNKIRVLIIVLLVITTIFLAGCTLPASPSAQRPDSPSTDSGFAALLLTPEDLPQGIVRAGDGPMQTSDVTDTMTRLGWQKGHRTLYADGMPLTAKSIVMEQDIMIFNGANASVMLEEHKNSFTLIESNAVTALPLPDPDIGEKSFAVKVIATGSAGNEIDHYVLGFVKSDIYEVFSMTGTPAAYPTFLELGKRSADKIP